MAWVWRIARVKQIDKILVGNRTRPRATCAGKRHIFFCFVDHFEPLWRGADRATAVERVRVWHQRYPKLADAYRDGGGRPPQHTFFYPQEEYLPECLDLLAELRKEGFGDVEIHIHHDGDTSSGFRAKVETFRETLHHDHGLLHAGANGIEYGFIHGNWALDDSGVDGRWCGVKDEITILAETGCYADFTYPSAPHPTQPPMINRIYYATDNPIEAASHHRGTDARFGADPVGDLLLVSGPLALNWKNKRRGILPAFENGDIPSLNPVAPDRVDLWVDTHVQVKGWPSWVFVKVHTHGAQEDNAGYLLGEDGELLYRHLLERYNNDRHVVHFVTARELFVCIRTLEKADREAMARIESFDYTYQP